MRIIDPVLLYASWRDGFGIKNALRSMSYDPEKAVGVILIIETNHKEVFGAFLDIPFKETKGFEGTDSSCVFTLHPEEKEFPGSRSKSTVAWITQQSITIGDGEYGPAIYLDEELDKGKTCTCDSFNSPPLIRIKENEGEKIIDKNRLDFRLNSIEIFLIH